MHNPPHQQAAETNPARLGPARSSHPPNNAADEPRNTKKSVYIQPIVEMRQSHAVVKSSAGIDTVASQVRGAAPPRARERGSQNTENPYAIPMQRWMARAAGGTSHRSYEEGATRFEPARAAVRPTATATPAPATRASARGDRAA